MNSTVLYNRDWHKGVVGIVASRVTEQYYRPSIILTESNGFSTAAGYVGAENKIDHDVSLLIPEI